MVIINIPRTTEAGRIRYSCLVNKKTSGGANHQTELFEETEGVGFWMVPANCDVLAESFTTFFRTHSENVSSRVAPLHPPEKCQTEQTRPHGRWCAAGLGILICWVMMGNVDPGSINHPQHSPSGLWMCMALAFRTLVALIRGVAAPFGKSTWDSPTPWRSMENPIFHGKIVG